MAWDLSSLRTAYCQTGDGKVEPRDASSSLSSVLESNVIDGAFDLAIPGFFATREGIVVLDGNSPRVDVVRNASRF